MADHLCRLAQRTYAVEGSATARMPNPLDVWIIGAPGWLAQSQPEPIRSICEDESADDYRIMIAGEGLTGMVTPRVTGWQGWTYAAGLKRKKRHTELARFRQAGELLLGIMCDVFDETGKAPTYILSELGVPVVCASGHNRESAPSNRIQQ